MGRRIEIELTSSRPDGSWTWRAAGAREPKGTLDGNVLYPGAKPGDVVKAEAEFELEGIVIISVAAPRPDGRPEAQRIEIIGPSRPEGPAVTTQLVGRRPGDHRRDREDRPRRERSGERPQEGRPQGGRPRRQSTPTAEGSPAGTGRPRTERPDRSRERTRDRDRDRERSGRGPARGDRDRERERPPTETPRDKAKRLNPSNTHRRAVLESLPPEQQPIAEQVLRGGIPAVRTALHLEREKAESEGRPVPNTDELVAMAEALLPRLKAAEWRDRAEAAVAAAADISLRDLRSVVAGADVARDEETRSLAGRLREALEERVRALHEQWHQEIAQQLEGNHVVRALRLSARPPEPAARMPAEVSDRLAQAAGEAMSPETSPDRWMALLEAAAGSPIRRNVRPAGLPEDAPPELKRAAHQHSGSIPALAALLGVSMPPPPVPVAARRGAPARRGPTERRGGDGGGRGPARPPESRRPGGSTEKAEPATESSPAPDAAAAGPAGDTSPADTTPADISPGQHDAPAADATAADATAADPVSGADPPAADAPAGPSEVEPSEVAGQADTPNPDPAPADSPDPGA